MLVGLEFGSKLLYLLVCVCALACFCWTIASYPLVSSFPIALFSQAWGLVLPVVASLLKFWEATLTPCPGFIVRQDCGTAPDQATTIMGYRSWSLWRTCLRDEIFMVINKMFGCPLGFLLFQAVASYWWKHVVASWHLMCLVLFKCVIHSSRPTRCRGAGSAPSNCLSKQMANSMT